MSDLYRCIECGATVNVPESRIEQDNDCPMCEARLPSRPIQHGIGFSVFLYGGLTLMVLLLVGGIVALLTRSDRNNAQGPQFAAGGGQGQEFVFNGPRPANGLPFPKNPNFKGEFPEKKDFQDPPRKFPFPDEKKPIPDLKDKVPFPPIVNEPKKELPPVLLKLPPLPSPVEITPTKLTQETDIPLPDKVERTVVGGSGRFLILHFPKLRKLGIFDVCEAKITKYIDLAEDKIYFAAGMNKLLVMLPSSEMILRYDLFSGEREAMKPMGVTGVNAVVMGHSSAGPLVIRSQTGARLYDITTFSEIPVPADPQDNRFGIPGQDQRTRTMPFEGGEIWPAANGRSFGNTGNYGMPNGIRIVSLENGKVTVRSEHKGTWFVQPSPDGKYVFAGGHPPTNAELRPTTDIVGSGPGNVSGHVSMMNLPAHHGPYYLQIGAQSERFPGRPQANESVIKLYLYGLSQPIFSVPFNNVTSQNWSSVAGLPSAVHLVPRAQLLILPNGPEKLRLIPVNLEKELEKSGAEFVVVTTTAPTTYKPGAEFKYAPRALSKAGGIKFKLESGPNGMRVDPDGEVTWRVPVDYQQSTSVILSLKDRAGKEAFHNFSLTYEGEVFEVKPQPGVFPPMPPPRVVDDKKGLKLPPNPSRLPVKPITATERTTYSLPDKASRALLAGDGRFLVLHFANLRKLGVFDLNEQKIVRFIDLAEDRPLLAVGMHKLVVYLPSASIIQRYNLLTGEREAMKVLNIAVKGLALGSASAGPLAVATNNEGKFFDLETLTELEVPFAKGNDQFGRPLEAPRLPFTGERIEVSANGRVFVGTGQFQSGVVTLEGNNVKFHQQMGENWIYARPSSDGKYIFRGGSGAVTVDGLKSNDVIHSNPDRGGNMAYFFLPAAHGPFYYHVHFEDRFGLQKDTAPRSVSIYMYGLSEAIGRLQGVKDIPAWDDIARGIPFAERLHLIPRASALITINGSGDQLTFIPFDPYQALNDNGKEFLLVTSSPPGTFTPGNEFRYPVRTRSKAGNVKITVETGPPGMKADASGLVTWNVPAAFADNETSVILSLRDNGGKEAFHNFRLVRSEKVENVIPEPEPEKPAPAPPRVEGPRIPYILPPTPKPLEFGKSSIVVRTEVNAAGQFDRIIQAGGGRFLLLHAKTAKKLYFFDVMSGKIERSLDLDDAETVVTAGMHQVFVYRGTTNTVEKLNLLTGVSEGRKVIATKNVTDMVMGCSSAGPILIRNAGNADLYDADQLLPMTLPKITGPGFALTKGPVWAAANGLLFANRANLIAGSKLQTITLNNDGITTTARDGEKDFVLPQADGKVVFVADHGALNEQLQNLPIPGRLVAELNQQPITEYQLRPTETPTMFATVYRGKYPQFLFVNKPTKYGVAFHTTDLNTPVSLVPIPEITAETLPVQAIPEHIFPIATANVVVFIPPTHDRLYVYPAGLYANNVPKPKDPIGPNPKLPQPPGKSSELPWKAPAVPTANALKSTLTTPTSVRFQRQIFDTALGGDGRYLLLYTLAMDAVEIYDLTSGKLHQTIPAIGTQRVAGITAGHSQCVVMWQDRTTYSLASYDLMTAKPLKSVKITLMNPKRISMGHCSEGPLLLTGEYKGTIYDLSTLQEFALGDQHHVRQFMAGMQTPYASPDGRRMIVASTLVTYNDDTPTVKQGIGGARSGPTPFAYDGSKLFPDCHTAVDTTTGRQSNDVVTLTKDARAPAPLYFPSFDGPYYATITKDLTAGGRETQNLDVTIYKYGQATPIGKLPNFFGNDQTLISHGGDGYGLSKHIYWSSNANVLAYPDVSNSVLKFVPLDVQKIAGGSTTISPKINPPKKDSPKKEPALPPLGWKLPDVPLVPVLAASTLKTPVRISADTNISKLFLGGGGRYVVSLPVFKSPVLYDLATAKELGTFAVEGTVLGCAVGQSKIVIHVTYRGRHLLHRFDLTTRQLELSTELPKDGANLPRQISMGYGSEGPILIVHTKGVSFVDLATLQPMQLPHDHPLTSYSAERQSWVTAARDGRTFMLADLNTNMIRLQEEGPVLSKEVIKGYSSKVGFAHDNSKYFIGYRRIVGADFAPAKDVITVESQPGAIAPAFIPAHDGPYYARVDKSTSDGGVLEDLNLTIYKYGQEKPIGQLSKFFGKSPWSIANGGAYLAVQGEVIFATQTKMFVHSENGGKNLVFTPLDLATLPAAPAVIPPPPPRIVPKANPPTGASLPDPVPFKLPPVPDPLAFAPVTQEATLTLNAPNGALLQQPVVRLAGSGRFVVIQRTRTTLDIVDLSTMKVIQQISFPTPLNGWVAGATKLYAATPHVNLIRFDLLTGKEEKSVPYPLGTYPEALGSSVDSPLLVATPMGHQLIDGASLKPLKLTGQGLPSTELSNRQIRASCDGRMFATSMLNPLSQSGRPPQLGPPVGPKGPIGPPGFTYSTTVVNVRGGTIEKAVGQFPAMFAWPAADGKHVFVAPHGGYDASLKSINDVVRSETPSPQMPPVFFFIPAVDGPFYLQQHIPANFLMGRPIPKEFTSDAKGLSIFAYGQTKPLVNIPNASPLSDRELTMQTAPLLGDLVHLIARANALVTISADGSKVRLTPVDLASEMAKSGVEIPWVTSLPPRSFSIGKEVQYTLKTASKIGELKYRLEELRAGMNVSANGTFTWTPAVDADDETRVTIRVTDAKGNSSLHSFVLVKQ